MKKQLVLLLLACLLISNNHTAKVFAENEEPKSAIQEQIITLEKGETQSKSWWKRDRFLGEWGGRRQKLEDRGITFFGGYIRETFSKVRGGVDNEFHMKYMGLMEVGLEFDTEKMGLWKGGTALVSMQNLHGTGLTDRYIQDLQAISNIDAPRMVQTGEYWYQQNLFDDKFSVKIGKQDANGDFCFLESASDFIHSSPGIVPTVLVPTYPANAVGVRTEVTPVDWASARVGVFDGEGDIGALNLVTPFDGHGGYVTIGELELRHNAKNLPGTYKAGLWYHNGSFEEITSDPNPRTFSNNRGVYALFEQMLYREDRQDEENDQGLHLIGQFGYSPGDRSEITEYYGAGLHYKGLIPHRENDTAGIFMAMADLSNRIKVADGAKPETAIEIFYRLQLSPHMAIQPDFMYIFNPGGTLKDAIAIGVRTIIDL